MDNVNNNVSMELSFPMDGESTEVFPDNPFFHLTPSPTH